MRVIAGILKVNCIYRWFVIGTNIHGRSLRSTLKRIVLKFASTPSTGTRRAVDRLWDTRGMGCCLREIVQRKYSGFVGMKQLMLPFALGVRFFWQTTSANAPEKLSAVLSLTRIRDNLPHLLSECTRHNQLL